MTRKPALTGFQQAPDGLPNNVLREYRQQNSLRNAIVRDCRRGSCAPRQHSDGTLDTYSGRRHARGILVLYRSRHCLIKGSKLRGVSFWLIRRAFAMT